MSVYVTDTHPLVWYASGKHRQLSRKAHRAFQAASRDQALIYVPVFVLWEIAMLTTVRRIALRKAYSDWVERLTAQPEFELAFVDTQVLTEAYYYPFFRSLRWGDRGDRQSDGLTIDNQGYANQRIPVGRYLLVSPNYRCDPGCLF